jgi:hypothetical protein
VTYRHVRRNDLISQLYDEQLASADLDVWLVLLGLIGATALAIGLLSIVWLVDLSRASGAVRSPDAALPSQCQRTQSSG